MSDPVTNATEDGSYSELLTPTNVPKAKPDPQAATKDEIVSWAEGESSSDPFGFLDLTGKRNRRGDP